MTTDDPRLPARFWNKVNKTEGCWIWTGSTRAGYGRMRFVGRWLTAHRVSYEWANGPIPDGYEVDHLCRNRRCVRPSHLQAVTKAVNIQRANEDQHPMTTESKAHRVVKSIGVKMHPYATCEDCGKQWPTNPATREEAKRHAADEDHRVSVVVETIDVYRREAR